MRPTERQHVMRRIDAAGMRRQGLPSVLTGIGVLGSTESVERATAGTERDFFHDGGAVEHPFSGDDVKHLLVGVGRELWRDPEFRALVGRV